jgi:hypothetical protein
MENSNKNGKNIKRHVFIASTKRSDFGVVFVVVGFFVSIFLHRFVQTTVEKRGKTFCRHDFLWF